MLTKLYPIIQTVILAALGIFLLKHVVTGTLAWYINERYLWLVVGAAVMLFALPWSAWPTREPSHTHAHDHTHHHVVVSRWGLVLIALPIILGVGVPAKPLGTSALANIGIETTAPTQVLNATSAVAIDLASTDRTILEWTQLFQYALDPSIYDGQLADVVGFTYRDSRLSENQMYVGRFVMRCCAADVNALGMIVEWSRAAEFTDNTWVRVQGPVKIARNEAGKLIPLIKAENVTIVPTPARPYLYP
jgi:uncharacterized repeat protein (TIGR03943 family)